MPTKEQMEAQPLDPATPTYWINKDIDDGLPPEMIHRRRHRKYVTCCGCVTALVLIFVVIFLVLFFTVFTSRSPKMTINSIKIQGLDRVNWTAISPDTNLTILADVVVKNPNFATFKFNEASTILLYDRNIIGLAEWPCSTAKAGRTLKFNVSMDFIVANFLNVSRLESDYRSGILPVDSYTRISGKVKILNIISRGMMVRTNCTRTVSLTNYSILEQSCNRKLDI